MATATLGDKCNVNIPPPRLPPQGVKTNEKKKKLWIVHKTSKKICE